MKRSEIVKPDEEICYHRIHCIDSFWVEFIDRCDLNVDFDWCQYSSGSADFRGPNTRCGDQDFTFSNRFPVLVFKTVVSGRLDTRTHINQQFSMGLWDLFSGNRL